jgi:hypothetical protein
MTTRMLLSRALLCLLYGLSSCQPPTTPKDPFADVKQTLVNKTWIVSTVQIGPVERPINLTNRSPAGDLREIYFPDGTGIVVTNSQRFTINWSISYLQRKDSNLLLLTTSLPHGSRPRDTTLEIIGKITTDTLIKSGTSVYSVERYVYTVKLP